MGKKGFTLLELLIVIVIIGILAAIGIPRYFGAIEKAKGAEAKSTLSELRKVEQAYYSVYGTYGVVAVGSDFTVDLDGDGTDDVEWINPDSDSFQYNATTTQGLATAIAGDSYSLDHDDGTFATF